VTSAAAVAVPAQQANATPAMPKVSPFELPKASLEQVAEQSGLQWVNSDPERIAQVQAAIAAEAKVVHVPRERPAAIVRDEGPLILVETKRDLRNMTLPFEETQPE
jgi:ribonuclease E